MMRSCTRKLGMSVFALVVLSGMTACGGFGGGGGSSISGFMAGTWDFTLTNAKGHVNYVIEANLNQDKHGNISATGSVTANGPSGSVSDVLLVGGSLPTTYAIVVDYLGFTCNGSDNGDRSITGTINASDQVTLTQNLGGSGTLTITGTLNSSGTPQFTGTVTGSGACGGSWSVTGKQEVQVFPGTYNGTSAADSTEIISMTLANAFGTLTATGTDSKLGNFTLAANSVGDFLSGTITYANSPSNSGPVFGYFDQQLGNGSILLVSYVGQNTRTCPNGEPYYQGSCVIAILALP